jgi:hypothetical protein
MDLRDGRHIGIEEALFNDAGDRVSETSSHVTPLKRRGAGFIH